jgi:hypothetical protein
MKKQVIWNGQSIKVRLSFTQVSQATSSYGKFLEALIFPVSADDLATHAFY